MGWKWWSLLHDRWWQGTQWSDTYREAPQPRTVQVNYDGEKYEGVITNIQIDDDGNRIVDVYLLNFPEFLAEPTKFSIDENPTEKKEDQ